jgi:glycosyltransferase involved in cell wall biosynthesis
VHGGDGWLGGRNYIRNLLTAVYKLPDRNMELVLFTTPTSDDQLADLPPFETVRSKLLDQRPAIQYPQKGLTALLNRNWPLERLLLKHRIDLLSHSGHLGAQASLPTLGWIPDFQVMHLPELQSEKDRLLHIRRLQRLCKNCTRIIVSSESVRADLEQFSPRYASKAEILRFVAAPLPREEVTPFHELQKKYAIDDEFFVLPNQFWAHKNHRTVITALKILRGRGERITVLATGSTRDLRVPGFFDSLMDYARDSGVLDDFRVLGIIPYADLAGLIKSAVALINPSLFEGWSTSVEESKTAGKAIVLSDIPVHREQNPERGIFFSPLNGESLADALRFAKSQFDRTLDVASQERAFERFPERQADFARRYQEIIRSLVV